MPPKKKGGAGKKPGKGKDDGEDADGDATTFTIQIEANAVPFTAESKEAFDCSFTFQFPGEDEAESTESILEWEDGSTWTKRIRRTVDREFLHYLEDNSTFQLVVLERSCAVGAGAEDAGGKKAAKGKKPAKGKPPKAAEGGEGGEPQVPAELFDQEYEEALAVPVNICSFFIDSKPVTVTSDPPPSLRDFKITVSINRPLLTREMRDELLPMEITIEGVKNLPSVPFSYKKMGKYYYPVSATYSFFNGRPPLPKSKQAAGTDSGKKRKGGKGNKSAAEEEGEEEEANPEDVLANIMVGDPEEDNENFDAASNSASQAEDLASRVDEGPVKIVQVR